MSQVGCSSSQSHNTSRSKHKNGEVSTQKLKCITKNINITKLYLQNYIKLTIPVTRKNAQIRYNQTANYHRIMHVHIILRTVL